MLSRLVITFLPRSKHLLISWLQSPSAVILEPKKIKSATVSTVSPSISQEVIGLDAKILVFWMLSFKPTFSLSSFTFIKRLFRSSSLFAIRVVSSAYLRLLIFLLAVLIPACASSSPAFHKRIEEKLFLPNSFFVLHHLLSKGNQCLFFLFKLYLFIFGCARSSLLQRLFSSCGQQELLSSYCTQATFCGGFSCGAQSRVHRLSSRGTWACGIFPDQGSNLCLLHWWADFLLLNHQESPKLVYLKKILP